MFVFSDQNPLLFSSFKFCESSKTVSFFFQKRYCNHLFIIFSVPLGSIPELPAESCKEIKASEGEQAVSGNYWFKFNLLNYAVLVHCDMKTEGKA